MVCKLVPGHFFYFLKILCTNESEEICMLVLAYFAIIVNIISLFQKFTQAVLTLIKKLTDINQCLTDPANRCLTDIN